MTEIKPLTLSYQDVIKGIKAFEEAVQTMVIPATQRMVDTFDALAVDYWKRTRGRLPGSTRTARLRKKRITMIRNHYAKALQL